LVDRVSTACGSGRVNLGIRSPTVREGLDAKRQELDGAAASSLTLAFVLPAYYFLTAGVIFKVSILAAKRQLLHVPQMSFLREREILLGVRCTP